MIATLRIFNVGAVVALLFGAFPVTAGAQPCVGPCGQELRACLTDGRPAMKACLHPCRRHASATPTPCASQAVDACGAQPQMSPECVSACKETRRVAVRRCLVAASECLRNCQ